MACGAVAVVVALLVGLIAVSGGDDRSQHRAASAQAAFDTQQTEIGSIQASMLTGVDFGGEWTVTDQSGLRPDELSWHQPCSYAPGLDADATVGRSMSLSYRLRPNGREEGTALVSVRAYRTAAEAQGQFQARADPSFGGCVAYFDRREVECSCHSAATNLGIATIPPPPGVAAVVYQDTLAYSDNGPQTYHANTAYITSGRYTALLSIGRVGLPVDQAEFDELLRALSQRLSLHAPS